MVLNNKNFQKTNKGEFGLSGSTTIGQQLLVYDHSDQLQFPEQRHHPLARLHAAHVDVAVIGVARKAVPVHALLATAACEATGTKRLAYRPLLLPRGSSAICEHQCGGDARLSDTVNTCCAAGHNLLLAAP